MKTIITQTINGHEIIKGFSDPVIEPIETLKKVTSLLSQSAEILAAKNKIKEVEARNKNINQTMKIIKGLYFVKDNPKSSDVDVKNAAAKIIIEKDKLEVEYDKRISLMAELKELQKNVATKRKEIFKSNVIYFDTKPSEKIIEDSEYLELFENFDNCPDNYLLKRNGVEIVDLRGVKYYINDGAWIEKLIEKIGVELESSGKLFEDLTDEEKKEIADEIEVKRVLSLSAADKMLEKESIIELLAVQGATMRSKLEIQGSTAATALKNSKTWYDSEVLKIEAKYK